MDLRRLAGRRVYVRTFRSVKPLMVTVLYGPPGDEQLDLDDQLGRCEAPVELAVEPAALTCLV